MLLISTSPRHCLEATWSIWEKCLCPYLVSWTWTLMKEQ